MSDGRLRELERRWQATGDAEDEAALLKERVRCGTLTRERLRLAVHLGHRGAELALSSLALVDDPVTSTVWMRPSGPPKQKDELAIWAHALVDAGLLGAFRATLTLAELRVARHWSPTPDEVEKVLSELRAWRDGVDLSAQPMALLNVHSRLQAMAVEAEQRAALATLERLARMAGHEGPRHARFATVLTLNNAARRLGAEWVFQTVADALLPWVLSEKARDPDPTPPAWLMKVGGGFSIKERGTVLKPPVHLGLGKLDRRLDFVVELRRPDGTSERCLGSASPPRVRTRANRRDHRYMMLVPVPKDEVPPGTEVWEVGP